MTKAGHSAEEVVTLTLFGGIMNVVQLKTGRGILRRMKRILETPFHQRRAKFGRGWTFANLEEEENEV